MSRFTAETKYSIVTRSSCLLDLQYLESCSKQKWRRRKPERWKLKISTQLDQLKNVCAKKLCSNIEVKNCLNYLVIGDLYRADNLKKASLQFIVRNMGNVFKSKEWQENLKDHPSLMAEVINAIAKPGGGGGDKK